VTSGRGQAKEVEPGLIEACRQGERDAFGVLFEALKDEVYSIALNFTDNQLTAQDVTQEVFLKLFSALRSFRGESNFKTWLFRVVVNVSLDEKRRRRRWVPIEEIPLEISRASHSQETRARQKELALQVRSAVANLAPKLRLPILLRYLEDLSYGEIAEVLGCSMGTVASRLNRGHKLLAQRLSHLRGAV
jgi:RNA polymerase sigma-70 factor (ECF subfamily)